MRQGCVQQVGAKEEVRVGVYKRGKIYYVRALVDGVEIRKAVGPDKALAAQAQKSIEKEIAIAKAAGKHWTGIDKIVADRDQMTFSEAAQNYLEQLANPKPSTVASYEHRLKRHLLPFFGDMPLADIKPMHIRKFQAGLSKSVSAVHTNSIVQLLRSITKQAVQDEVLDKDPCVAVKRLEEQSQDIDPFDSEELELLLSKIEPHHRPFFTVQAYTGARPNELMALRFSDVDWKKAEIRISKGRVRGKEGTPKTASSKRIIPLCEPALNALLEVKSRSVGALGDYVFVDKKGQPVGKHLYRVWKAALSAAGIRHRPSYQLRHTFISQLLLKNIPVQYVAKLAGHSGIETTVRCYARWIDSETSTYDAKMRAAFAPTASLKVAQ